MNRREFIAVAGVPFATRVLSRATAQRPRTRLILLGTGGGPTPKKSVSASAQVIIVDDAAYVVDCGDGVARQLVAADVPLRNLKHIFIPQHNLQWDPCLANYGPSGACLLSLKHTARISCYGFAGLYPREC